MRSEAGVTPGWNYRVVLLDGEKVDHVYLADEEQGYIEVWPTNERGVRLRDLPLIRREGQVRLLARDEWEKRRR